MKGPYERFKYDLRRVWECPACHHRQRTSGAITFVFCRCQREVDRRQQICMRLVEDSCRRLPPSSATPASS